VSKGNSKWEGEENFWIKSALDWLNKTLTLWRKDFHNNKIGFKSSVFKIGKDDLIMCHIMLPLNKTLKVNSNILSLW